MTPEVKTFLEHALTRNIVFGMMFGALLPLACEYRVKQSFAAGLKIGLAVALSGTAGLAIISLLPPAGEAAAPVAILAVSLTAAAILRQQQVIPGELAGLPMPIIALAPLAGIQIYIWSQALAGIEAILAAFGAGFGYMLAIAAVSAVAEQIRISEAPAYAKRSGTLWFTIALFAAGFAGFQFL